MATKASIQIEGLASCQRALRNYNLDLYKELQAVLKEAAGKVRDASTQRFSVIDVVSAGGYKVHMRGFNASVEQSIGRTTGLRPDFGSLQMTRAMLPALDDEEEPLTAATELMLAQIAYTNGLA